MNEEKKSNSVLVWSVGILVIAIASFGLFKYIKKDTTITETPVSTPVAPTATPTNVTSSLYRDGTYSAVGEYLSPSGMEQIGVQLTLAGDVVTDVTVEVRATRPESKKYQEQFNSGYKTQVVGKKISEVNLGKISGSSLTPKGFNAAIESIKATAKA